MRVKITPHVSSRPLVGSHLVHHYHVARIRAEFADLREIRGWILYVRVHVCVCFGCGCGFRVFVVIWVTFAFRFFLFSLDEVIDEPLIV